MLLALVGGALAGLVLGYVLQRGQLCFHSAFRGLLERRTKTFRAWASGAAVAAVGLAVLAAVGPWSMSSSLPLRPLANIAGGLVFGVGMVVAASCVSGLFYKLGAGMLGAGVGLAGWAAGELAAGQVSLPGGQMLAGRNTLPTLLGLPRPAVALAVAVLVLGVLAWRYRGSPDLAPAAGGDTWRSLVRGGQWRWPVAGVALGLAVTWTWVTAGAAGAGFGASTSGAVTGLVQGNPNWWQVAFLVALIPGATVAARTAGGWWVRGEVPVRAPGPGPKRTAGPEHGAGRGGGRGTWRYAQLATGGLLLGAGARWAGGCNLGHAMSGVAQLNLSSLLVVAAMIAGVAGARAVQVRLGTYGVRQDPAYRALTGDH